MELAAKLKALRDKHGTPPNIIHIMWDDTAVGEIGVPQIQKTRGWETPNMNQFSAEGIYFARMYTEPSCTPSRAAAMTGRHAIRNGMYNVGFPHEYGGLAAEEVTMAEVLERGRLCDRLLRQVAPRRHRSELFATESGLRRSALDALQPGAQHVHPRVRTDGRHPTGQPERPNILPDDPYDIDKGWKPKGLCLGARGRQGRTGP